MGQPDRAGLGDMGSRWVWVGLGKFWQIWAMLGKGRQV